MVSRPADAVIVTDSTENRQPRVRRCLAKALSDCVMEDEFMAKKVEVSYNPQLGYLATVFKHDFDFLTGIRNYEAHESGAVFEAETYHKNKAVVMIDLVGANAVRFQMFPYGNTDCFRNEVFSFTGQKKAVVSEMEEFICITNGQVEVRVRKHPWEVSYYYEGRLITKEQVRDSNVDNMCKNLPVGFTLDENKRVQKVHETMYLYTDESFYGFGEKFTDFNKRGQTIHCWQTDALSTNTEQSYKNHPFFLSSRGYAVLLNSFTRSRFDMGTVSGVAYNMEVEDKYLDYMILFDTDPKALLRDYTDMTGAVPMIPKWAFGLWMSKCSYRTQEEIYEVVRKAEEHKIKIDVIHIDGWQRKPDAGAWEWDLERFPDPAGMIHYLREHHIRLSLWIYPYIDEHSTFFEMAREKGYLVKDGEGQPVRFYATAMSESKAGCFDFTNPEFLAWYRERVKAVIGLGVGVVKTDFSEAVPEYAVYYDGSNGVQGHNKLTFLYAKTIYDIMKEVKTEAGEYPMLWGRSGYAGSHTIPAAWAGDSSTHLNNHASILRGGLSIAMSGVPFWGFDMGGFYNTDHDGYECPPKKEEYLRSCQFGLFSPLSRCHGKTPREPWNFGAEAEEVFRTCNDVRHRLLPYLYTAAHRAHTDSVPMLRPLVMEYPQDRNVRHIDLEYLLGDSLLVAPVFDQDEFAMYLPEGRWADFHTHEMTVGGRWIEPKIHPDRIPVYIRENAVIPLLTQVPEDIEEPYGEMELVVHLNSKIDETVYDVDRAYHFEARCMEDDKVMIDTDLPAVRILLCMVHQPVAVTVNGRPAEVERVDDKIYRLFNFAVSP